MTKMNPTGSAVVYSTYLGGNSNAESGWSIAVDNSGNAYIGGHTFSTDFPTSNPFQGTNGGGPDAFVTKLNATGNALLYSTYLGGSGNEFGYSIAVDSNGSAYITGVTSSTNFPVMNPFRGVKSDYGDVFVTKLSATGTALIYSTYLGGNNGETGFGIAVDGSGNAYITGETGSTNFPTLNPIKGSIVTNEQDVFVTKLNATGNGLVYSTYLGGTGGEIGLGIAVDSSGSVYIAGHTEADDFPISNPFQGSNAGESDAFVTKLNAIGNAIMYSTYLGGTGGDYGFDVAIDSSGSAYITGYTASTNFPILNPLQGIKADSYDVFVTKLSAAGNTLIYSTYLGGNAADYVNSIAVDSGGNAIIVGQTQSTNFPTTNPYQAVNSGLGDAFIAKLNDGTVLISTSTVTATNTPSATSTFTATPSITPTGTPTSTATPTITLSATVSLTPTHTATATVSRTPTFAPTATSTVIAPHPDTIGIFRLSQTTFYLRNSNTTGYADSVLTFGASTYFPIVGDWNGDGIDTPGVYQSSIGLFYLTNSTTNPAVVSNTFTLGIAGDQPIVGDWDGDGKDGVGVFRPSNGLIYLKNNLTTGFADFTMVLGIPGDVGIAGDWNGDGKDSPGVYRPSNQVFYLTNSICNCAVFADAQLGLGIAGDKPFVGDWDADGKSGVGVYRQSNGLTYIKNALTTGFADSSFVFGSANDYPLAGYWVRVGVPSSIEPAQTFQPAP